MQEFFPRAKLIGWILCVLVGLMLLASAGAKLAQAAPVVEGFQKFGMPAYTLVPIGVIEVIAAILFLIPQTSFFGAILVTGYMGGAIVTHVRVEEAFIVQALIPTIAWLGCVLRRPEILRAALGQWPVKNQI